MIYNDDIYMQELFKEFCQSQELLTKKNKNKIFENWMEEKQKILSLYYQFLVSNGLISIKGIAEFGKSEYDSVLNYIPINKLGLLITDNYYDNKKNKNVKAVSGNIIINNKDIILEYGKKQKNLDFIQTYISTYPYKKEDIDLLCEISKCNKQIFVGAYGNKKDLDREQKLKYLYETKVLIESVLNKNIDSQVIETSNYYMAMITPKYVYKRKK